VLAIVAAVVVWCLGWALYFRRCAVRVSNLRNRWYARFEGGEDDQSRMHDDLLQRTGEVGRLLRGAGIPDGEIPYARPVGWGQIATGRASLFDNWLALDNDVPSAMNIAFGRAIGIYVDRSRQALNPFWWIGLILTAPRHLARWIGGTGDGAATKLLTLLWAIVVGIGTLLGIAVSAKSLLGL
jgi:hypothetical protein